MIWLDSSNSPSGCPPRKRREEVERTKTRPTSEDRATSRVAVRRPAYGRVVKTWLAGSINERILRLNSVPTLPVFAVLEVGPMTQVGNAVEWRAQISVMLGRRPGPILVKSCRQSDYPSTVCIAPRGRRARKAAVRAICAARKS